VIAYVLRRVAMVPLILFGVATLVFLMTNLMPQTAIYVHLGDFASEEQVQKLITEYDLDKPIHVRYVTYMSKLIHGDLGRSIVTRRPVMQDILTYLPASVELILASLLFTAVIGIAIGVVSAIKKNTAIDVLARGGAVVGLSLPRFWLGIMLLLVFFYVFRVLPARGRLDMGMTPPIRITGMYVFDSLVTGNWATLKSAILHLILPSTTLVVTTLAGVVRMTRNSMLEVLSSEYIAVARALGVRERKVVFVYGLKNAVTSVMTLLGLMIGGLFSGTFLVEKVFAFPGIGRYATQSIIFVDYSPVIACALLISLVYALTGLFVDLMYAALDPRVRLQ
jgi:peptide/nickel transport system permease protein